MKAAINFQQKLYLGFGTLTLAILGIGAATFFCLDGIQESDRWVDHTIDVIDHFQDLQFNLKKAQAAYRAFLIVRDPHFMQTNDAAIHLAYRMALEARTLTRDNPSQQARFDRLMPLLQDRLAKFNLNSKLCLSGHVAEALAHFKDPANLQTNDDIDGLINEMIAEEQNLLIQRRAREEHYTFLTLLVLFLGGAAATLFAFTALMAINREIRAKARAQELLQLNEMRLFQFLEAIPLGIFIADASSRPYYVNRMGKELLGQGVVSGDGRDPGDIYRIYVRGTDQPYPLEKRPMHRALRGERSQVEDLEVHPPDGRTVPLEVWGTPVTDAQGNVQYGIVVFSDITERKELEAMKAQLISVVSHQLKTPVGEISSYAEVMLDGITGDLNPRQKDYLMDMRQIAMECFQMISSFLDLSKLERGMLKVEISPVYLSEIVQLALRDYLKLIERKGLGFDLVGLDPTLRVMADREKMVECLRNLINNSVKFTDKGRISLIAEPQGDFVLLRVKDTGPGLSQKALDELFSPKRVLGTDAAHAGAGLGLYIVKQLLKLQGGDIVADSRPGEGACFTLSLVRSV